MNKSVRILLGFFFAFFLLVIGLAVAQRNSPKTAANDALVAEYGSPAGAYLAVMNSADQSRSSKPLIVALVVIGLLAVPFVVRAIIRRRRAKAAST
jgi:hypothetical protein